MPIQPCLSVTLPNFGTIFGGREWHQYAELVRAAEQAGAQRLVVVDHVVMGPNTEAYQWGPFPGKTDEPWLEPLSVLSAVASVTTHMRLATGVIIAPLRPAAVLAKTAATVDVLSAVAWSWASRLAGSARNTKPAVSTGHVEAHCWTPRWRTADGYGQDGLSLSSPRMGRWMASSAHRALSNPVGFPCGSRVPFIVAISIGSRDGAAGGSRSWASLRRDWPGVSQDCDPS